VGVCACWCVVYVFYRQPQIVRGLLHSWQHPCIEQVRNILNHTPMSLLPLGDLVVGLEPGIGSQVLDIGYWVLGIGSRLLGLGSWVSGLGSRVLGLRSWVSSLVSWVLDLGSRSWVLALGSRRRCCPTLSFP
jgi:hypothetical protein